MKGIPIVACAILFPLMSAAAQAQAPTPAAPAPAAAGPAAPAQPGVVLTMQQTIDEALDNGDDNRLLAASLALARFLHQENVSHNLWGLAGSAGLGYNLPGGDPNVVRGLVRRTDAAPGGWTDDEVVDRRARIVGMKS